jgi:hypothetical protein
VNEGFDVDIGAWPGNENGDRFEIRLGWLPGFLGATPFAQCADSNGFEAVAWTFWVTP